MIDIAIAPVRKTMRVKAPPDHCFKVFTADLFSWWPKSHAIHTAVMTHSEFEPFVGGRYYARFDDGLEIVNGHVTVWEPPARLVFSWEISADWKCHPAAGLSSEVEVLFRPDGDATIVELEHRHFERMDRGEVMRAAVDSDGGWSGLLRLFAEYAEGAKP